MNNIKSHIPKSLNFQDILASFKKVFWIFLIVLIVFNIALFYFLSGAIYFIALIVGNILFMWSSGLIVSLIAKSILVTKWEEVVEEVKEKFSKENVVKAVKK